MEFALSAAFDLYSWKVAYKELVSRKEPQESTWQEIIGSKDPTVFTVFLEDSAGLVGGGDFSRASISQSETGPDGFDFDCGGFVWSGDRSWPGKRRLASGGTDEPSENQEGSLDYRARLRCRRRRRSFDNAAWTGSGVANGKYPIPVRA